MKTSYFLTFFLTTFSITYSQDITATLADTTASTGFTIVNAKGDTVFRVTGEGNVGIGNNTPFGLLDTRRTRLTGQVRSIFLQGESKTGGMEDDSAGDAIIAGGDGSYSSHGGKITMEGGKPLECGGDVKIQGGNGDNSAGSVKIQGGNSYYGGGNVDIIGGNVGEEGGRAGNINITTSGYHDAGIGGDINLTTGVMGGGHNSGNITLKTSPLGGDPGGISLLCGEAQYGSDIHIEAGNSIGSNQGGDIDLTPGTGNPDGLVVINGSGTYTGTWTQASDERFKKDIQPLTNTLEKIEQLNGVSYKLRKDEFPEKNFTDERQIGLIAQQVEKVFPELVKTDNEGYKFVAYQNVVAVLIEAIKEQQKIIYNQNEKINEIRSTLNSLINKKEFSNNN